MTNFFLKKFQSLENPFGSSIMYSVVLVPIFFICDFFVSLTVLLHHYSRIDFMYVTPCLAYAAL